MDKKFGGGEKFGGVQGGLISDLKVTYSDLEVLLSPLPVLAGGRAGGRRLTCGQFLYWGTIFRLGTKNLPISPRRHRHKA